MTVNDFHKELTHLEERVDMLFKYMDTEIDVNANDPDEVFIFRTLKKVLTDVACAMTPLWDLSVSIAGVGILDVSDEGLRLGNVDEGDSRLEGPLMDGDTIEVMCGSEWHRGTIGWSDPLGFTLYPEGISLKTGMKARIRGML